VNSVGNGNYATCATGPNRLVWIHADATKPVVLPTGVTQVTCTSRLTLMTDKLANSPVNISSMLVTSPVIGLGAKDAPPQCPQDPGAPNGCGAYGNHIFPVPTTFDCQPYLYWQVLSYTAVSVRVPTLAR
jgi:hypothetical protein